MKNVTLEDTVSTVIPCKQMVGMGSQVICSLLGSYRISVRDAGILRNDSQEGTDKACSSNIALAWPRKTACLLTLTQSPLPLRKLDRPCPYLPLILLP